MFRRGHDGCRHDLGFSPHTRGCSAYRDPSLPNDRVFPAYAGMFPGLLRCGGKYPGFPRIRGDVPNRMGASSPAPSFSPHTRGCSALDKARLEANKVFPAYAGMFRIKPSRARWCICFPRIRGDVPDVDPGGQGVGLFSPHTRGCSEFTSGGSWVRTVFPAYAGMFRISLSLSKKSSRFPRIRGDVPLFAFVLEILKRFSPHTRGCSQLSGWDSW